MIALIGSKSDSHDDEYIDKFVSFVQETSSVGNVMRVLNSTN